MPHYEVIFAGEMVDGAQPERVRANLGKIFQADSQRLDLLLSGRRLVLKNNLDAETAEKYRATLERAGARVHIETMSQPVAPQVTHEGETVEEVELAPPPDQPNWTRRATPAAGNQSAAAVPRDLYAAAFMDVVAPNFTLARTGSDVQDPRPAPVAPVLDLSGLSLAPVGSDMGQLAKPQAASVPDTSHLKVL